MNYIVVIAKKCHEMTNNITLIHLSTLSDFTSLSGVFSPNYKLIYTQLGS